MSDPCCNSFGGRITIEIDGKAFAPTDADIELDPTNIEVKADANQDGSPCFMSKPKLFGAKIKLRNPCGMKWNEAMRKCAINATIVEEDNNRTHLFTGSRLIGSPAINLSNGQVDGLEIRGSSYTVLEQ